MTMPKSGYSLLRSLQVRERPSNLYSCPASEKISGSLACLSRTHLDTTTIMERHFLETHIIVGKLMYIHYHGARLRLMRLRTDGCKIRPTFFKCSMHIVTKRDSMEYKKKWPPDWRIRRHESLVKQCHASHYITVVIYCCEMCGKQFSRASHEHLVKTALFRTSLLRSVPHR